VRWLVEDPDDSAGAGAMLGVLAVVAHLADASQLPLQAPEGVNLVGHPADLKIQ
jgi:hypothetical protein